VDGTRRWQMVKTGSSYLSQSELPLTFGLGASGAVQEIEIAWPNGRTERLPAAAPNHTLIVEEGRGVVDRVPFRTRRTQTSAGPRR
jgi:hypothetical protein